jgi:hypothetical protein
VLRASCVFDQSAKLLPFFNFERPFGVVWYMIRRRCAAGSSVPRGWARLLRLTCAPAQQQYRISTSHLFPHFKKKNRRESLSIKQKMESIDGHSEACCNIPPIISKGYQHKGKYETIGGGLKTCMSPYNIISTWPNPKQWGETPFLYPIS